MALLLTLNPKGPLLMLNDLGISIFKAQREVTSHPLLDLMGRFEGTSPAQLRLQGMAPGPLPGALLQAHAIIQVRHRDRFLG